VLTLLILIGVGIYVLVQVKQEPVESAFVPTPTPTRLPTSYVAEAEDLYRQGNLEGAIAAYERALEMGVGDVEATISLARLLALERRTIEAVEYAEQAVDQAPESAQAWAVLGMVYDWHAEVDRALETCQHAIELAPDHADAYAYLAEAQADAGQWAEATHTIQTAVELDDQSVNVQRNYGYVMEVQGNYWEAVRGYKQALTIHPNLAYLHIAVGKNYLALGDFDRAIESFEKATEVDSNSEEAYYRLGRAYYERGKPDEAQAYLEQAIEADPQYGPAYGYLAFTYWSRRDYEDAIPNLERAITLESRAARRRARGFILTVEDRRGQTVTPSSSVAMSGDFSPLSLDETATLQADLEPLMTDQGWQGARGSVTLDTRTGVYTVTLEEMPETRYNQAYVGWFEGVKTLSGDPLNTGQMSLNSGDLEAGFDATWVRGPRIDYFYTLGLAHFYLDKCEEAYPLFEAALQINPEAENARQGIRLCDQADD
jgi:tetratricopeptide (TPR) repeat protein